MKLKIVLGVITKLDSIFFFFGGGGGVISIHFSVFPLGQGTELDYI